MTIDVNLVTAQIAMYNWRGLLVQVAEALQDLLAPFLDCFHLQMLMPLSVISEIAGGKVFCDEVDTVLFTVCPAFEASDYVGMIQVHTDAHFCSNLVYLIVIELIGFPLYFAPGYVNAMFFIKAFVHTFESAGADKVVVAAKSV